MIDERRRKKLILEHSRRVNAGDLDGLLALYAEDVVFEDPVGSGRRHGRAALREHFGRSIAAHLREEPGEPVAAQDGVHALVPVSGVMDYLPKGPEFVDHGWLTAPADPASTRLRCDYAVLIRTGAGGLIEELRSFWGRSDLDAGSHARPDETARKELALEYARRMNGGDPDSVLELFADDVRFEDPVGTPALEGKTDLRRRIAWSMKCQVHETPGRPVTSMDGRWVVVPSTVTVHVPTKLTFRIIGVMEIDESGLSRRVQAFWGLTDTHVGDGPQPTGVAQFVAVTEALTRMGDLARDGARSA